jgi:hypothetical protein
MVVLFGGGFIFQSLLEALKTKKEIENKKKELLNDFSKTLDHLKRKGEKHA